MKQKTASRFSFTNRNSAGFTLIELLVVIAILGLLATVGLSNLTSAQMRSRDAKRKSDLKQVANALELYYQDHQTYPDSSEIDLTGEGEFTDTETIYVRKMPKDPHNGVYSYKVSADNLQYQLFAHLENENDKNIVTVRAGVNCGGATLPCNFAITSANTLPTDSI